MSNLSIILCTYNEEKFILKTLNEIIKNDIVDEIIIIDDDSKDKTVEIINQIKNKKIKLIVRKDIRGFASALNLGISISRNNHILRFDVDMYASINYFLDSFKKYKYKDCVIFSRYIENGKDLRGNFRKITSAIINKICVLLLSPKIKDYTSCIFFLNKKILKDTPINNTLYANFIIEFIFSLIIKKKEYLELPFTQTKDTEENSKSAPNPIIFIKNGLLYISTIIKCFIIKIKN